MSTEHFGRGGAKETAIWCCRERRGASAGGGGGAGAGAAAGGAGAVVGVIVVFMEVGGSFAASFCF